MANLRQAPILQTNSITKKQMSNCMEKVYGPGRIQTSDLMQQKPITTEPPKRILPNTVVRYSI